MVSKGDYVVLKQNGIGKAVLLKVTSANKNTVEGYLNEVSHIPSLRQVVEAPVDTILVNLGGAPAPGKVYGADTTNLFRGRTQDKYFGTLNWFYLPEKKVKENLAIAMKLSYKRLKKHGLEFLADDDIVWEIKPYTKEKYAGMYMHPKREDGIARIAIRPEKMTPSDYSYVILHELGHRLHKAYVTGKKVNARWIQLFNTSIRVINVTKSTSERLLEDLLKGEACPSDFRSDLEEEDALAYRWIVRFIASARGVSLKELDLLFEADMKDELRSLWPVRTIPKKDLQPIVSEYATLNYHELFAESFAYYMVGTKLQKPVLQLMEKSISFAKANREKK